MRKNKSPDPKRGSRISAVLMGVSILLLIIAVNLLGYANYKQSNDLNQKKQQLNETKDSLKKAEDNSAALNTQLEELKATLADCSAYLSEDDMNNEDELPSVEPPAEEETTDKTENKTDNKKDNTSLSYQKKYKNLYASTTSKENKGKHVVHLTFDDGPSQNTPKVLDILDEYNVKATFFVVYVDEEPYSDYYKEIVDRGHTIAIHTASHNYKKIYASVDAYLEDFNKVYSYVYEKTGEKPTLFRYPGGSTNCASYSSGRAIMEEMNRRGFTYYDWNVSSGDGGFQATRDTIYDWVTSKATKLDESVVLMHDSGGKAETVAALPSIISTLKNAGCTFEPLTPSTEPVQYDPLKLNKK